MYEIEVTVTTSTRTQLKVTADWPLIWLQAPGPNRLSFVIPKGNATPWIKILRKLLPGEIVSPVKESVKRLSFPSVEVLGRICESAIAL